MGLALAMAIALLASTSIADASTATRLSPRSVAAGSPSPTPTPVPTPTPIPKPQYVPLKPLPAHSGTGPRVVYSRHLMHVWLVARFNVVIRDFAVTGRPDWPLPGKYHVYSKSRHTSNPHYNLTFNYMTRFAYGRHARIGFHTIPKRNGHYIQPVSTLGQPLGLGGCVRMTIVNARFIYYWTKIGTRVFVLR